MPYVFSLPILYTNIINLNLKIFIRTKQALQLNKKSKKYHKMIRAAETQIGYVSALSYYHG